MKGKVFLVGAGPGEAGLLTLRGAEVLQRAEVVVYDRLVGPGILAMIPPAARRIDVGKQPRLHPVPQWRINEILLEQVREGKTVVRLKGGDPFLFGRGGEELEGLAQAGIPFEVVPGVTSALAAPASAGIPVTHRDWASSLHIVTGHARAGKKLDINFAALKEAGGTCVFLMGMSALEDICAGLLSAGMDSDTPAAVVEQGTLPAQRKVVSNLKNLVEDTREVGLSNPAVIVVGAVVALSAGFDWFSRRPLFGQRVVLTRPRGRSSALKRSLEELGAKVLNCPCIETVSSINSEKMGRILDKIKCEQWICFTSSAGVDSFFDALWQGGWDARSLGGVRFAVIGPATGRALERRGLHWDYMPRFYDSEHLARGLARRAPKGALLLRSAIGTEILPRILREEGVSFSDIPVYDTRYPQEQRRELQDWLREGKSLVTFTSGSTVRGFVELLGEGADFSRVQGVSIGLQTAAVCRAYSIPTAVAEEATSQGVLDCILKLAEKRREEP